MRTYKFRIYPSKMQETEMCKHLWIEKELWNNLLEANKRNYLEEKKFLTKKELQKMVKDKGLYSQVAQTLSHRLHKAIWRMVKLRKQGKECGFPRFKNIDRMKSLNYPQFGFSLGNKLKVTPFGEISIKKHREVEGKIKTLSLKKEASGKWFATFCVEQEPKKTMQNKGEKVGIDLGLMTFATLSDGTAIKNPRHLKKYEDRLAWQQRILSRKKRGSTNRKNAKLKVARLHEKVSNARADFLHKLSTQLVRSYSLIALEKLASRNMAEQNFGKFINDAGWNMFANMLRYKAEETGCEVVFVNPKNTTQECSSCGIIVPKDLSCRVHNCSCGLTIDRDLNAARNILIKATEGHSESNACGDETIVSPLKQEARAYL